MAVPYIIEDEKDIPKGLEGEYKKNEDGKYVLDVTNLPKESDITALLNAKNHEKEQRKKIASDLEAIRKEKEALEAERDTLKRDALTNKQGADDVGKKLQEIDDSYAAKLKKIEEDNKGKIESLTNQLKSNLLGDKARELAAKISTSPELLLPHIEKRLTADLEEGVMKLRILDSEGKLSALTLADLEKELVDNKSFSAIIKAGDGSGSSSKSSSTKFGGANNQDNKPLKDISIDGLVDFVQSTINKS